MRECDGSPTLCARMGTGGNNVPIVLSQGQGGDVSVSSRLVPTLKTCSNASSRSMPLVCIPINTMIAQGRPSDNGRLGSGIGKDGQPQNTLSATHCHAVCFDGCVRRLTPIECERLQGFPDNYTKIPYRGKPAENCPDAPRYKAIGNSWPVPVIKWIGRRITKELEECQKRSK